ncbi:oocyte zinc finger protein XlCOF7.1-like [Battus philenor]|uniref:oocyte zinc finger protein XlCOF7.1-like n=1 Tax=Battus philenor TaxID=42288 RepID=UPI0035D02E2F
MLSPRDDDDDDNHLCIKCNATIVGLENYIKHRKQRCGKTKSETKSGLPIDPLEPIYSLGADVFFQSLELQSSVKKTSLSRLTPPTPTSKTRIDRKTALTVTSTSRELPRISPVESDLRGVDWIGGHSLRIGSNEDNQTKLINAVASISGNVKKELPSTSYSIATFNDFKGDDDSDECDESEEDDEEEHGAKWKPPPHYTGGKWRPASPEHEDWDMREEQEHTGGKWKPLPIADSNDREEDFDAPPPGHTKGKWVPGAPEKTQIMQTTIQTKGSVQYWCGPCNRRLGSRAIYEKHLMSNLHMRKMLPEHELEFSGHLEPIRNVTEKRASRPSRFLNDSIYQQPQRTKLKMNNRKQNINIVKPKRKRKACFVHCSVCKSRVRHNLMGKHLISHYHFRKATDTQSPAYQQLILDNIDVIIHQSPFQCSPCRFYTNWLSNFMQHWFSDEHKERTESMEGRFWCSFCKYECESSDAMVSHISGPEHSEVVAVVNRSMPIILRKKTIFTCATCSKEFRYNIEIKHHCRRTGHELPHTATDVYQELHKCQQCKQKFKSSLTLAAHLKSKHKQRAFFCLVCSVTFKSSSEAKQHRQTSEHRVRRKEILREKGLCDTDLSKKCPYCTDEFRLKNVIELKKHIQNVHPNMKKRCSKCGMSFTLFQEVTRHIRSKACQYQNVTTLTNSILWNCSQCEFTTDSQAECFFHEVLHSPSITKVKSGGGKVIEKFDCPLCPKSFGKSSLRDHLKRHTFERPYVCAACGANFTRQSSLSNHWKTEHGEGASALVITPEVPVEEVGMKCGQCGKKFTDSMKNSEALAEHERDCAAAERRCPHEGCLYVATTAAQLIRHRRAHGENIRNHKCPICPFSSDQASHMKRHMLCHEGIKPYACPHCQFTCGSLENLRKHVLRSGRHEGLFLYECCDCKYQTNMAAELRAHYVSMHPDKYNPKTALEAVKTHLMKNVSGSKDNDN